MSCKQIRKFNIKIAPQSNGKTTDFESVIIGSNPIGAELGDKTMENNYKYEIYCGSKETMESVKERGVRGLNPKTMRWQIVDRAAKYKVVLDSIGASLFCDIDLRALAEKKNLILQEKNNESRSGKVKQRRIDKINT